MAGILSLLSLLAVPLMFLNAFGGIVAGIWLAILGEWAMIGWGIAAMVGSAFALSWAMMPSFILVFPAAYFFERKLKLLAYPFVILGSLYNNAVITAWCGFVLAFFVGRADDASLIPSLLWSYGAAIGPLAYMTQQERQGGGDTTFESITTYFAQIGFIAMVIAAFLANLSILQAMLVLAGFMAVSMAIEFTLAIQMENAKDRATT